MMSKAKAGWREPLPLQKPVNHIHGTGHDVYAIEQVLVVIDCNCPLEHRVALGTSAGSR